MFQHCLSTFYQVLPDSPDERRAASNFVALLMREAHADRALVLRGNVRLLKELFQRWHQCAAPPRHVVLDYLRAPSSAAVGAVAMTTTQSSTVARRGLQKFIIFF